jgi:hypothetical protein
MSRSLPVALGLLCLAFLVGAASASAAPPDHGWDSRCGPREADGAGVYRVRAYGVVCAKATRTARRYGRGEEMGRWRCDPDRIGDEDFRADCVRGGAARHQHVRFRFGA